MHRLRRPLTWTLFALAATLAVTLSVGAGLPTAEIEPRDGSAARVVLDYAEGRAGHDPLVLVNGAWAKASNVQGVVVDGVRYFYAVRGHQSFDPLSRGELQAADVRILGTFAQAGATVVVYTRRAPQEHS